MKMVRKQVYITQAQDEKLKRLAEARGQTEAEVVRAALDGLLEVAYEVGARESGEHRVAEAAGLEYNVDDADIGARARERLRRKLAKEAWEKELAFMRQLAASKPEGGTLEGFNRDELYEERLSQILHRH